MYTLAHGTGVRLASESVIDSAGIRKAYTVLLSAHFQGFCRDLHSECSARIVRAVSPVSLHAALRTEFTFARRLDRGNPNPGNIGADFNRLGLSFWDEVRRQDAWNEERQSKLVELSEWRNAITHQDFKGSEMDAASLTVAMIKRWRRACDGLALWFDRVIDNHVASIEGSSSR